MVEIAAAEQYTFYVRRAMTDTMPLHWILPLRQIFDHEILFVEQGSVELSIGGKTLFAEENDVILLPPKVLHTFRTTGGRRLVQPHLHLDFTLSPDRGEVYIPFAPITDPAEERLFRENVFAAWGLPYLVRFPTAYHAQTALDLLHEIIAANMENTPLSVLKNKGLVPALFLSIATAAGCEKNDFVNKNQALFSSIELMLERQLTSYLDLTLMARSLGYSKNYLTTLYKARYGVTIKKRYETLKIAKAVDYLRQSQLTVSEISFALGFLSTSDFSRYFKSATGVSPTAYRKSLEV